MLFNSFEFIYFLIIMVVGYYLISNTYRWLWLLLGSYYFYTTSEPVLVLLLMFSTIVDYFCGLYIYKTDSKKYKKLYLGLSICINVGLLIAFKYLSFFSSSLNQVLDILGIPLFSSEQDQGYNLSSSLLPVGISFYTFQTMSYTIEVYRNNIKPEKHLGLFALYVSFFPQLVAGPIEKASRLIPQLKKNIVLSLPNIEKGLIMIGWGMFLKVVVADRLGVYVDEAFIMPNSPHGFSLILGSVFFGFQIYYDFSAYTSIAIGTAKILGIDLMQNFNRPFFATSSSEFWKKWHISLMQWMRDYLYRPLVVNLKMKRIPAVLLVFFIIGLWHGANWTFVVWSMLNAILLILEVSTAPYRNKLFRKFKIPSSLISLLGCFVIMGYLALSLVFFRSPSISAAITYLKSMGNLKSFHINLLDNYLELFLCFVFIIIVQVIHYSKGNSRIHELVLHKKEPYKWFLYFTFILILVLFGINRQDSFIYFQF